MAQPFMPYIIMGIDRLVLDGVLNKLNFMDLKIYVEGIKGKQTKQKY